MMSERDRDVVAVQRRRVFQVHSDEVEFARGLRCHHGPENVVVVRRRLLQRVGFVQQGLVLAHESYFVAAGGDK